MKKANADNEVEQFYMELPQADYLGDIDIQDAYDEPNDDQTQGLSEEQVTEIARDSRRAAQQENAIQGHIEQNLFSDDEDHI